MPENAFVFGDSIESDLKPAKALGINTYHVTNALKLEETVKGAIEQSLANENAVLIANE